MATKTIVIEENKTTGTINIKQKILEVQPAKHWPGLSVEVREICTELGIPDINMNNIPAEDMRKAV